MSRRHYDPFKILLIGDSGAGKSCIIHRFSDDQFIPNFITTIGIDFKIRTIEVEGKRIKVQVWDTAGHERYRTITKSFYRDADGVMLVYDITNGNSFDNIAMWMRSIAEHSSTGVEKMLLGNKCDLVEKRVVSRERGEKMASENDLRFFETSAKTNINIDTAFFELAKAILKKAPSLHPPFRSDRLPLTDSSCQKKSTWCCT